jgi:hypothetical protein
LRAQACGHISTARPRKFGYMGTPTPLQQRRVAMLVDSGLHNNFHFDDYRRMAAIASMCVQPEVSHWPSMGEVVQALLPLFKDYCS